MQLNHSNAFNLVGGITTARIQQLRELPSVPQNRIITPKATVYANEMPTSAHVHIRILRIRDMYEDDSVPRLKKRKKKN
jgi:hypothetical protein